MVFRLHTDGTTLRLPTCLPSSAVPAILNNQDSKFPSMPQLLSSCPSLHGQWWTGRSTQNKTCTAPQSTCEYGRCQNTKELAKRCDLQSIIIINSSKPKQHFSQFSLITPSRHTNMLPHSLSPPYHYRPFCVHLSSHQQLEHTLTPVQVCAIHTS